MGYYGDAIWEVSNGYAIHKGTWWSNYSYFPRELNIFFERGGHYGDGANGGIFSFGGSGQHVDIDTHDNRSFRLTLTVV